MVRCADEFDQIAADHQAKSDPLLVAALEVVECAEQLEQVTLHSIWHANSRVFDGDSQKLLRKLSLIEYFLKGNLDIPTKCVLGSITHNIENDLLQSLIVVVDLHIFVALFVLAAQIDVFHLKLG